MTFDYPGYDLTFIQKQPCTDGSAHLFTLVYKFFSPVTKLQYILLADYHEEDVFAVKFYAKKDSKSDYKYSKIINKGDLGNILITCLKALPLLLQNYPTASFGFVGARTIDATSATIESYRNNQRFRIYRHIAEIKIGQDTFQHFIFNEVSGYLLVNRSNGDVNKKQERIVSMFASTYENLVNV